jgi:integrase
MAVDPDKANLTVPYIKSQKPKDGRERFIWDEQEGGLGVRIRPSGAKTWVFQYRFKGRPLRMTLGNADAIHPATARKLAIKHRAQVAEGKDPAAEKAGEKNAKLISELCDEYLRWLERRTQRPVKPSTLINERSRIETHIKPLLGRKPAKSLDAVETIERFFQDVADGKTAKKRAKGQIGGVATGGLAAAHRATDTLGSILQYALTKKIITLNPVPLFKRKKEKPQAPPFSVEAVKRVGKAMRELEAEGEPIVGIRAARHLLLSGFRRMEGLTLKWGRVDAPAHCARLEDTKTGAQIRPLGQAALNHLAAFKPKDAKPGDHVFPGPGEAGHYVGAPKSWARIAKRAGIEDVSLHGLRHWFASAGAELGYSDIVIGAIIGHAKKGITGRYATAPDSALIFAADRISQHLAEALEGKVSAKVVQFGR